MLTRLSKVMLIWAVALFASLVVFNNVTDYGSNFTLIRQVLMMDTIFPDSQGRWRAIDASFMHHAVYVAIIAIEFVIAVYCWIGGFWLYKQRHDARAFNQSKGAAIIGLTLGILLWFGGFMTIGGEWFLMWQSQTANGQDAAFRLVVILNVVLIYLVQNDDDKLTS